MRGHYGSQESARWANVCFDIGAAVGGAAQAVGSVAAAAIQADATKSAAKLATDSANRSADLVQGRYTQTRSDFQPYRDIGGGAATTLAERLPELTAQDTFYTNALQGAIPTVPGEMTQANLESTPGYKFTLSQGLQATQNSAAARGLGVSGAALKGAATFATGLSDQTYAQRFANQQALFGNQQNNFGDIQTMYTNDQGMRQNAFNRLMGVTQLGQNSAAQTGSIGNAAANQAGGFLTSGASAAGAGLIAGGNAAAGGINGITNGITSAIQQNRLYGDQSVYGNSGGGFSGGPGQRFPSDATDPFAGSGKSY